MSSREKSGWYGLYRAPLDWIEARSFKLADLILVNSKFTLDAVRSVVPDLKEDAARVLYPGAASVSSFSEASDSGTGIIHVARFAAPKNHLLLVKAFGIAREKDTTGCLAGVRLFLVGGYDDEVLDVRLTFENLKKEISQRDLQDHVDLLTNISDAELDEVWKQSALLVYPQKTNISA